MPYLEIVTNVSKDKITPQILTELSKCLADISGKPEQFCAIRIVPDQLMTFAGTTAATAMVRLMCIGKLGVEENKVHSLAISEFIEGKLEIPRSRMYIVFEDKPSSEVGYDGTTFHQILGKKKVK